MHRMPLPIALCGALAAAGCSGLISFDVSSTGTTTVQGSPLGGVLDAFPAFGGFGNLSFSQSADFRNNNTNKDHVSSCHLTRLTLKVTSPAGGNLDFLSSVHFYIQAQGLDKVHLAGLDAVPKGATTVDLQIDDRDIAAYVKQDSFSITTTGTGRSPTQNTDVEADLTLHVNASLL